MPDNKEQGYKLVLLTIIKKDLSLGHFYKISSLIFLFYINDITVATESSEVRLFVHDTILCLFVDDPIQNAEALNTDLEKTST